MIAAGPAAQIHQAETDADDHRPEDRIQEEVIRDGRVREDEVKHIREEREEQDGRHRADGKGQPAEVAPAEHQDRDVAQEGHEADRQPGVVVDHLRQTADPAADEVRGDQEKHHPKRLDQTAQQDHQEIFQVLFVEYLSPYRFHTNSLCIAVLRFCPSGQTHFNYIIGIYNRILIFS